MMIRCLSRTGRTRSIAAQRTALLDALEDRLLFSASPIPPAASPVESHQSGVLSSPPPVTLADITTDNTGDNAAVINALLAQNNVVVLPSGMIRIAMTGILAGDSIVIPQGKTLVGQSDGSTVLNFVTDGATSRPRGIRLESNTTLQNLTIQQTGQALADDLPGILVFAIGKENLTIANCAIRGPSTTAQWIQSSRTVPLFLQDCNYLTMQGTSVSGAQAHFGAEMNNVRFANISNCHFFNNGWDGLKFYTHGTLDLNGEIADCTFYSNGQSTAQFNSSDGNGADLSGRFVTLRNCVAYDNFSAGFQVKPAEGFFASDITFINCEAYQQKTAYGAGQHGFAIVNAGDPATDPFVERIQFIDCRSHHNDGSGFWIGDRTANVSLINSIANSNNDSGLLIRPDSINHVVAGYQGYGNGILFDPAFNLIVLGGHHHRLYDIYLSGIDPVDQNLTHVSQYSGQERSRNLGVYANDPQAQYGGLLDLIVYGIHTEYAKTLEYTFGSGVTLSGNLNQFQIVQRTFSLAGPTSGFSGLPVNLQLTPNFASPVTSGYVTRIDWNGDNQDDEVLTGTVPTNLTHTFANSGSHLVRVTVTSPRGISTQTTHTFSAADLPQLSQNVISGPATAVAGQQVQFTLGGFQGAPPAGQSYRYDVDWNSDGNIDQTFNGTAELPVAYTFSQPGAYLVSVTMTDIYQRQVSGTLNVSITGNAQSPTFTVSGPSTTEAGQPIQITVDRPSGALGNYTLEIDWDGDLVADETIVSSSASIVLQHVFSQPGSGTVTFTMTDANGLSDQQTHAVQVLAPVPTPDFHLQGPTSIAAFDIATFAVQFDQVNSGTFQILFDWDGDGLADQTATGSDGFTLTKSFQTPGTYQVNVTLVDQSGHWKTSQHTLTVTAPPAPTLFVTAPTSVMRGQLVQFELTLSRIANIAIDWNGDGIMESLLTAGGVVRVSHVYFEAGPRTIAIQASDNFGQMAQVLQQLLVTENLSQPSSPTPSLPASNSDEARFAQAARILGQSGNQQNFAGFSQLTAEQSDNTEANAQSNQAGSGITFRELPSTGDSESTQHTIGQDRFDLEYRPERSVDTGVPYTLSHSYHRTNRYSTAKRLDPQAETVPSSVLERMKAMVDAETTEPSSWWKKISYQFEEADGQPAEMTYFVDEPNEWTEDSQHPSGTVGDQNEEGGELVGAEESNEVESTQEDAELMLVP